MPGTFLAEFEFCVMLAIAHLGDDAYGATVRQEIERRTDRPVSVGALYTTLARLDAKGLLILRTVRSEPGQRGRARRYCKLTPAGSRALQQSAITMSRMMRGFKLAPERSK